MSATLTVQNDDGDEDGANGYNTVAEFKAYCDDRAYSYATYSDTNIQTAIVRTADYIDTRFVYKGTKLNGVDQTTEFPRDSLYNRDGVLVEGIPAVLKKAAYEYEFRALSSALYEDVPMPDDGRPVIQESITTGPVTTNQTFASPQVMTIILGEYPAADRILMAAGFVLSSRQGTTSR